MKVVMILFNEDRDKILCGGLDFDRFIELPSTRQVADYYEIEDLLKEVGLSALNVKYKLLGYSSTIWVSKPNTDATEIEIEYIVTGVAYNISHIEQGYDFKNTDEFIKSAVERGEFKRLGYLQRAIEKMNIER